MTYISLLFAAHAGIKNAACNKHRYSLDSPDSVFVERSAAVRETSWQIPFHSYDYNDYEYQSYYSHIYFLVPKITYSIAFFMSSTATIPMTTTVVTAINGTVLSKLSLEERT